MKTILTAFVLVLSTATFAQLSYEITVAGNNYTAQQVQTAIEASDFCGYYYPNERHLLKFDDGTEVELKSGDEMQAEGNPLPQHCITEDRKEYHPIWSIAQDGTILRGSHSQDKNQRVN